MIKERPSCAVCGGKRGSVKQYPEYLAHIDCYKGIPIGYVLWCIDEARKTVRR